MTQASLHAHYLFIFQNAFNEYIFFSPVQVWDHTSCADEEDEPKEFTELCQLVYQKNSDSLTWAPNDLKHYGLKELIINGYQIEEKFIRYTRRVVEAAVNLELVMLLDFTSCEFCNFSASTRYPRTEEERYHKEPNLRVEYFRFQTHQSRI